MRTEFDMKINTMAMYRFLMNHAYRGMSGLISILAGVGLIAYYFLDGRSSDSSNSWIFLFFGILFLVYQPWTLYSKALKQTKLNPVFKHPLHYVLTEEILEVQQAEASSQIEWDKVWMVRETAQSILVYTGQRNAFIWVKAQMQDEKTVRTILKKVMDQKRLKLK